MTAPLYYCVVLEFSDYLSFLRHKPTRIYLSNLNAHVSATNNHVPTCLISFIMNGYGLCQVGNRDNHPRLLPAGVGSMAFIH